MTDIKFTRSDLSPFLVCTALLPVWPYWPYTVDIAIIPVFVAILLMKSLIRACLFVRLFVCALFAALLLWLWVTIETLQTLLATAIKLLSSRM